MNWKVCMFPWAWLDLARTDSCTEQCVRSNERFERNVVRYAWNEKERFRGVMTRFRFYICLSGQGMSKYVETWLNWTFLIIIDAITSFYSHKSFIWPMAIGGCPSLFVNICTSVSSRKIYTHVSSYLIWKVRGNGKQKMEISWSLYCRVLRRIRIYQR